jgi:xanthine dehydrogenase molybdenum-binding subunit
MAEYQVIGKPVPRVDAVDKVTGAARYAADMNLPGMLWGKFVRSPHPHARIKRIDTSKAEALPGVRAVVTQRSLGAGATIESEDKVHGMKASRSLFADEIVRYQGAMIAAVAATTPEIAAQAIELVEVEYEILPAVDDVVEASKPGAPLVRPDAKTATAPDGSELINIAGETHSEHGDVAAGFAQSDRIFEDDYFIPRVHQTYIEPHACLARVEPNGRVTIWTSTQSIFSIRSGVASSLGIPMAKVNVIGMTIGGGFGGKFGPLIHPYAVILSQITGHPVKMVLTREEEMLDGRPAPGAWIRVKTGVKNDGTVMARHAFALWDSGAEPGASIHATGRILGVYKFPNIKVDAYAVYTNKPGTTAYRAPGAPQGSYPSEAQLDRIAVELGIDPVDLRLKNMAEDGDMRVSDRRPLSRVAFKETLRKVAEAVDWWNRKKEPNRGWGVAVGEWTNGSGPGSVVTSLQEDGTVRVFSGSMDISGTDTGMAQITAEVLGVPYEDVYVIRGDTDSTPYATGSGGSVVLFSMGNAAKRGAEALRDKMLDLAAQHLEADRNSLAIVDRAVRVQSDPEHAATHGGSVSLTELAQISLRTTGGPLVAVGTFASEPSHAVISAQIVQVQVDPDTGRMEVLKLAGALDVGRAINPYEVEGQMEGGAIQGLSWGWMEEMQFKEGRMLNTHLSDYRIPTTMDAPPTTSHLIEKESANGPFGVKGIGEPPIVPTPAALHAAVADAIGVRINTLPLTPERIFMALHKNGGNGHSGG